MRLEATELLGVGWNRKGRLQDALNCCSQSVPTTQPDQLASSAAGCKGLKSFGLTDQLK